MSIRPEHVALSRSPAADAWAATVVSQEFLGDRVDLEVRLGETVMIARTTADSGLAEGAPVFVTLAPEHCLLFPAP